VVLSLSCWVSSLGGMMYTSPWKSTPSLRSLSEVCQFSLKAGSIRGIVSPVH
jgi:hypothetical protein